MKRVMNEGERIRGTEKGISSQKEEWKEKSVLYSQVYRAKKLG
jgi:hypothetical protein